MSDYGYLINPAMPGVIADTGDYNIDGACFVSGAEDFAMCGKIAWAKVVEGQYKEVSTSFDSINHVPYGVVMRSQYDGKVNKNGLIGYESGSPASLLTHGRVWVISQNIDQPPTFGDPVHVARDGTASKGGVRVNGWSYTGGWYKWNGDFFIVEIQLKQNSAHVSNFHGVLVNGAVITSNLQSPQAYDKVVTFTVNVSPEDATNKTGTWHVTKPEHIEIMAKPTENSVMIKGNNYVGDFHVIWVANDGSGVQSMMEFRYDNI